ncbi:M20 family metallopeptidase [Acidaminobacter hydrogenoformans]|uniref:Succinyl-diaminopimelate desuccinylase n=1 Tax=Acidaminobacter hydrogenoformans DSM 2784 TaxID=1120920 RepID=A0A1G5S4K9_9FIRM|nr:ArgE/DapE family deacylase [Acidaminobacter hydrogenoformans]SCZ81097.1 succinyl-diaminopimelate desuccinylase [Acidaminobacter hydrogenoformans DSM 2784]
MSVTKDELLKIATSRSNELIELTAKLIRINSENPTGSQREVIDFVKKYLEESGIEAEELKANEAFPCVLAKIGNDEGPSIILNGHVDVVPAGDLSKWRFDPYCGEVTDTLILGRGTSDMKAGVAGILFAMRLLKESEAPIKGNVRLHIVSDEESGGQYGTKWLCEQGYSDQADACIVAEPTSNFTIEIGQKGSNELVLKAHGTSAHGSLGNYKGDNAIIKLTKVLQNIGRLHEIRGQFSLDQAQALENSKYIAASKLEMPGIENVIDHVTASVGIIQGGTKLNMVPDYCEARVDIRLPIGADVTEVDRAIQTIIDDSDVDGVEYDVTWKNFGNSTSIDAPIVQAIKKYAEEIWDIKVLPAYQWASSDARYYREKGIPTIQYGPANTEGIHSYNENVDIQDVINANKIYLLSLCDLLGIN